MITRLLLGGAKQKPGYVARVALAGAHIIGKIDLTGGQIEHELLLERCWLDKPIDFTNASSKSVVFDRTHLFGLRASGWKVAGSVCFDNSHCDGEIRLRDAKIDGYLSFNRSTLSNPHQYALFAEGLTVNNDMLCRGGFTANGEIRLRAAHITGTLDFDGATLNNPGQGGSERQ